MNVSELPAINAGLNTLCAMLLGLGYGFIKQNRKIAHRNCMIGATVVSAIFLVCYVTYHLEMRRQHGSAHTTFLEPRWFRPIYLTLLLTHVLLAIGMVPMILLTLYRGLAGRFEPHKRLARWTWPVWMYVSVTGVLVYFLLYHIFPQR